MHLVGLYDQIRLWGVKEDRLSPPCLYAKRRAQWDVDIHPMEQHPEWQERKESLWQWTKRKLRDQSGLLGFDSGSVVPLWFGLPTGAGGTKFESALNVAYVPGTSGNAVGTRWISGYARTVASTYSYISAFNGTAASCANVDCYIRADNSGSGTFKPTTASSLASSSYAPSSALGWHKCALSYAASANTYYWSEVGATAASGTNYCWIIDRHSTSNAWAFQSENIGNYCSYITSGGWTSTTQRGCVGQIVTCFTDGSAIGDPFSANALSSSNTNDKGLYLGGLTAPLIIMGMQGDVNDTHISNFKVYPSGSSQGGTTTGSGSVLGNVGSGISKMALFLSAPCTLATNTPYRLVFTSDGTATTSPRRAQIGTVASGGSATDLQGAFPLKGTSYYTAWNGSAWTDTQSEFPIVYVWVKDQGAAGGGGGGPPVAGGGGGAIILG